MCKTNAKNALVPIIKRFCNVRKVKANSRKKRRIKITIIGINSWLVGWVVGWLDGKLVWV